MCTRKDCKKLALCSITIITMYEKEKVQNENKGVNLCLAATYYQAVPGETSPTSTGILLICLGAQPVSLSTGKLLAYTHWHYPTVDGEAGYIPSHEHRCTTLYHWLPAELPFTCQDGKYSFIFILLYFYSWSDLDGRMWWHPNIVCTILMMHNTRCKEHFSNPIVLFPTVLKSENKKL